MNPAVPKLALVTGATGGIGKATSIALAKAGYSLALHYNTASEDVVNDLLTKVRAAHASLGSIESAQPGPPIQAHVKAFRADLGDLNAVRDLHAAIVRELGDPAVVFLNAGTTAGVSQPGGIGEVSLEVFEQAWRVNTVAPYLLTQLCVPAMERAGFGRIVYNSSVAALTGGVVGPHYASSKSALHGLLHWLAGNVAGKGITVNAVAPALIEGTTMMPGGDEGAKRLPVGRYGRPEEIADTVLWMVKTGYLTNKVITVDGGWYPQ